MLPPVPLLSLDFLITLPQKIYVCILQSLPFLDSFPDLAGGPGLCPLLQSLVLFWAAAAASILGFGSAFLRLILTVTVTTVRGQPGKRGVFTKGAIHGLSELIHPDILTPKSPQAKDKFLLFPVLFRETSHSQKTSGGVQETNPAKAGGVEARGRGQPWV